MIRADHWQYICSIPPLGHRALEGFICTVCPPVLVSVSHGRLLWNGKYEMHFGIPDRNGHGTPDRWNPGQGRTRKPPGQEGGVSDLVALINCQSCLDTIAISPERADYLVHRQDICRIVTRLLQGPS